MCATTQNLLRLGLACLLAAPQTAERPAGTQPQVRARRVMLTVLLQAVPSGLPLARALGLHTHLMNVREFMAWPKRNPCYQLLPRRYCCLLNLSARCHLSATQSLLSLFKLTFPAVSGASPLEPGLSSVAPQWCRASGAACTVHGCPCRAAGFSY